MRLRKYGVQATIDFDLYEIDGVDLRTDWTPAAADCEIMKDGGASTQCTNTATDEGSTYSIVLTSTEMEAARLVLKVVDAAVKVFLDRVVIIETYGNASAQHSMDLDDADGSTLTETGGDGAQLTEAGGTGDQLTAINLPNQTMDITGSITGNLSGSVGSVTGAVGSVSGNVDGDVSGTVATLTTYTGNTPQTADNDTKVSSILALLDDARAEPGQAAPPVNPDMATKIDYLYKFLRNKILTSATEIRVYDDAGTTVDHKSTISDDGTDFTRGEFETGP